MSADENIKLTQMETSIEGLNDKFERLNETITDMGSDIKDVYEAIMGGKLTKQGGLIQTVEKIQLDHIQLTMQIETMKTDMDTMKINATKRDLKIAFIAAGASMIAGFLFEHFILKLFHA